MERVRNGTGEAITNGDAGIDGEDDLVDTEEIDRPKQIRKSEVWTRIHCTFSSDVETQLCSKFP